MATKVSGCTILWLIRFLCSLLHSGVLPSSSCSPPPKKKGRASWRYFTGSIWRNFPSIINEIIFPSFLALPPPPGANLVLLRCCYLKPLTLSQLCAFLSSAKPRGLCREKSVKKKNKKGEEGCNGGVGGPTNETARNIKGKRTVRDRESSQTGLKAKI